MIALTLMSEKNINKSIGINIRNIRRRKGMTGNELAKILNVSQQQVSRYERGTSSITVGFLFKISLALCVDIENLLEISECNPKDYSKE